MKKFLIVLSFLLSIYIFADETYTSKIDLKYKELENKIELLENPCIEWEYSLIFVISSLLAVEWFYSANEIKNLAEKKLYEKYTLQGCIFTSVSLCSIYKFVESLTRYSKKKEMQKSIEKFGILSDAKDIIKSYIIENTNCKDTIIFIKWDKPQICEKGWEISVKYKYTLGNINIAEYKTYTVCKKNIISIRN